MGIAEVLRTDVGELIQRAHYSAELRVLHALMDIPHGIAEQAIYRRYAAARPHLQRYGFLDERTHRFERIRWGPQREPAQYLTQFAAWLQSDVADLVYSMTRSPAKPSSRLI